jgi:hypothetical protein
MPARLTIALALILICAGNLEAQGARGGSYEGGTWTTLGSGLAGTGGVTPILVGAGTLTSGSSNTLHLTGALPDTVTHLVIGFGTPIFHPFKGGTLWPYPDFVIMDLPVSSTGTLDVPFTWPSGIAAGTLFWMQHWILDAGGPHGFSSTNGLQGEAQ